MVYEGMVLAVTSSKYAVPSDSGEVPASARPSTKMSAPESCCPATFCPAYSPNAPAPASIVVAAPAFPSAEDIPLAADEAALAPRASTVPIMAPLATERFLTRS